MASSPNEPPKGRPRSRNEFQIALVCALEVESVATKALFDCVWEPPAYGNAPNDSNSYTAGRIGQHDVVLAYLPSMGSNATAKVVANISKSYPSINLVLVIGICGGATRGEDGKELILGDVVISERIVQPGFGRRYADGLRPKDTPQDVLPRPTQDVLAFLHKLRSDREALSQTTQNYADEATSKSGWAEWKRPAPETDVLFEPSYRHKHQTLGSCEICNNCVQSRDPVCDFALKASCAELGCEQSHHLTRHRIREAVDLMSSTSTAVHFGPIACSDEVMKSAVDRDAIAEGAGAIAFEMEGVGAWGDISTIVVKGVCDYADSHKNKAWQRYAAMIGAGCTKALLKYRSSRDLQSSMSALTIAEEATERFKLPNIRVRYFQGRTEELQQMDNMLCPHQQGALRVCVIRGVGGQGKTQLALEFCRRKTNSPFEYILWLDASSEEALTADFKVATDCFRSSARKPTSGEESEFVRRELQSLSVPWLIVFDNYDDIDAYNILDYFPDCDHGAILITSRHAGTDDLVKDQANDRIILGGVDSESATSLLLQRSGISKTEVNSTKAALIAQRLGNHALAIVQAAPFIKQANIGLENFLEYYELQRRKILEAAPKFSQYRRTINAATSSTALSVFTTWELSFRQLELQPNATGYEADFLTMLSLLDFNDISEDIFKAYPRSIFWQCGMKGVDMLESFYDENGEWSSHRFFETAKTASELALLQMIQSDEDKNCHLRLHPLIKDWLKLRCSGQTLAEMHCVVSATTGQFLGNSFRVDQFHLTLLKRKQMTLHAVALETDQSILAMITEVPSVIKDKESLLFALRYIGTFAFSTGLIRLSESVLQRVLDNYKKFMGESHSGTISTEARLVRTYYAGGRQYDAVELGESALIRSKQVLGDEDRVTLSVVITLVAAYLQRGEWKKAEDLSKELLERIQRADVPDELGITKVMDGLASTYLRQGRLKEAEELRKVVLERRKQALGADHPSTLADMANLAAVYDSQGKFEEAERLGLLVLDARKLAFGEEDSNTLLSMQNLALTYMNQGKSKLAQSLMQRVIDIRNRLLGEEHPEVLGVKNNLALNYSKQGRWDQAGKVYIEIVPIQKRVLGKEHPDTLTTLINLARCYTVQGRLIEAEALGLEVVEVQKRVAGETHPYTLMAMNTLAVVYFDQNRLTEAIQLQEQIVAAQKQGLGEEHPHTLASLANLGLFYGEQGRTREAQNITAQVLESSKKSLGEEHPDTLNRSNSLAVLYWNSDRREEAAKLMSQVVELRKQVLGTQHPDSHDSINNLINMYRELDRWQEADVLEAEMEDAGAT